MADPWLKFYPSDWRNDPALKMCSMAARGLWIELICLMHQATPYGHLLINGKAPTDEQIAVLVGAPSDQIAALLGELESAGIFSRTRNGTIYSRKLTRMAKKAATARNNGRKGGNPNLSKEREKSASDNPEVKGEHKPQKPEPEPDTEKKERTDVRSQKARRKSRLPDDWRLPADWGEWALGKGLDELSVRREAEKFACHHQSKGNLMLDWRRAWQTWVNNSIDWKKERQSEREARKRPEPGDRRTLPDGRTQYYANHYDGWMNEVC